MVTPEPAFERLLAAAGSDVPDATWQEPGDLGRMSMEAMIAAQGGDARDGASKGSLRLHGVGVLGNAIELDEAGQIATLWQRTVQAVGGAIEGSRSAMGRLPIDIVRRTQLLLDASPVPGSVVLNLTPKAAPDLETTPNGMRRLFDTPRPLADRASEQVISLLSQAADPQLDQLEAFSEELRQLGPRVATSVRALATALNRAHVDVDVVWVEPEEPTRRTSLSATNAGWLSDFVAGRQLDAEEVEIVGTVRTVSDLSKWSVESDEGIGSSPLGWCTTIVIRS